MGEALVVNGVGYCRAVDASSPSYLKTRSGPALTSGCLVGLGPLGVSPMFRLSSRFPTSVTVSTLCSHIVDLTQLDALYVAGVVTFRRGDLAGSALCRPPIFGENILDPANVGKYFCSPQALALDNAERAYITGVVARNVDGLGTAKAPCLGRDLRRILYRGASASLTQTEGAPGRSEGAASETKGTKESAFPTHPEIDPTLPEMHIHALVLREAVKVADIVPDLVAPEGVLHLDCKTTKIMTFELEVFAISKFSPHNA
jgi:hypothetical protein